MRNVSYLGHVMRGDKYHVLQLIIEGKIEGWGGVERKQMSWLRNIRDWTGVRRVEDLFRMVRVREFFAAVVVNVGET
jgi:hypothetical protein